MVYHWQLFCGGKNLTTLLPAPDSEMLFRLALLAELPRVDRKVVAEAILADVLTRA
jgi:hypothetical protein